MIKLIAVKPVGDCILDLTFSDGSYARWSAAYLVERNSVLTRALAEPTYFSRAFIESGALAWPNGLELSASALYRALDQKRLLNRQAA